MVYHVGNGDSIVQWVHQPQSSNLALCSPGAVCNGQLMGKTNRSILSSAYGD